MTKIIGHRGAVSLGLENTINSFKQAKNIGVDGIELDIQSTKDGALVVFHDRTLKRLAGVNLNLADLTYEQLAEIHLKNDETIPLLYDVLALISDIPVVLDIKTDKYLPDMFDILAKFPKMELTIVTKLSHIISTCKQLRPDIPALVERHYSPFGLVKAVKKYGADGLNLNYYWLNPLTYRLAEKHNLQIQAYTINNLLVAHMVKRLYPGVWICTNHPDKFLAALGDRKPQA